MADNITGEIIIKWADGVEQTVLGDDFTLEESGKSGDDSFDQFYIGHIDHPETGEEGKIYLETRIDKSSGNVSFSAPEAEGGFEITESDSLNVESPDYEDEDFDED